MKGNAGRCHESLLLPPCCPKVGGGTHLGYEFEHHGQPVPEVALVEPGHGYSKVHLDHTWIEGTRCQECGSRTLY